MKKKVMKKLLMFLAASVVTLSTTAQVDRSKAPAPGPAPKIQIKESQNFTLDNGLKVIVVENHKIPKVSFQLTLDNDPVFEGDKAGVIDITGRELIRQNLTGISEGNALHFNWDLLSGMYFLKLTQNDKSTVIRFVVE